ncbi:MAG: sodium:solute symporter [Phycisphaeraceae bacterium]
MPTVLAVSATDWLVVTLYLGAIAFFAWRGFRTTRNEADYLLAGRRAHPAVMALSYGAAFISTSAIVGFGGVAALFGMSLLWLTFLNIAVGIFLAFVFLGEPTRRMGLRLGAHTFPELLGKRFDSRAIQVFAGLVVFLFMPLYAAAVLAGGARFAAAQLDVGYDAALMLFAAITAGYVIAGGLKAVMAVDTLQGTIMAAAMIVLLVFTYHGVGGVTEGHQALSDLAPMVPESHQAIGHRGWTAMPALGWGSEQYNLGWIIVSTIILGVGIGALAQPQLAVRFMTVSSGRELRKAVPIGACFILLMVGVPYLAGSLSNAWFARHGELITGEIVRTLHDQRGQVELMPMAPGAGGQWEALADQPVRVLLDPDMPRITLDDGRTLRHGRALALHYAGGDPDQIMPRFITAALPGWFGLLFFLSLLAAAMSTLSGQFHTIGSSFGRDVLGVWQRRNNPDHAGGLGAVRLAMLLGLASALTLAFTFRDCFVIARFTAIFFGLCAATFMPAFLGGLFWRRMTRPAAIASMATGFAVSLFWLVLVKAKEASAIGLVQQLTGGQASLLEDIPNWPVVDPILVALPISTLVAALVTCLTPAPDEDHLSRCFPRSAEPAKAPPLAQA